LVASILILFFTARCYAERGLCHSMTSVRVSGVKLFSREIIFEVFQPMWSRYLNVANRQANRQTEAQTT